MTAKSVLLICALAALVTACGTPSASDVRQGPSPSSLDIPTSELPADVRCLLEHGGKVAKVIPPDYPGDKPTYEVWIQFGSPEEREAVTAIQEECAKLAEPPPELSDADIREIFDRLIRERDCLVELGYTPAEPPSYEAFLSSWRTGPWDPLDGVDTAAWSDAEYQTAKDRCILSTFERD